MMDAFRWREFRLLARWEKLPRGEGGSGSGARQFFYNFSFFPLTGRGGNMI
jgi:hypothetical protein